MVNSRNRANDSLATSLNLPPPKLLKHSPIPIPEKVFKRILGTFKASIPEDLPINTPAKLSVKSTEVIGVVGQLCTKLGSSISEAYILKTLEPVLQAHPRRESLHVVLAATFLLISSHQIETPRKLSATAERKKMIDAFDGRFTNKELSDWIKVIESDLEESKWFQRNPVKNIESTRKRKAEGDTRKVKLAKNITGVGIMVCLLRDKANSDATGSIIWDRKTNEL